MKLKITIAMLLGLATVASSVQSPDTSTAATRGACANKAGAFRASASDSGSRKRKRRCSVSTPTSSTTTTTTTAPAPVTSTPTPTETPPPTDPPPVDPPPVDPPASDCPLATPGADAGLNVSGCTPIASDTASNPDPIPFWGRIDCQNSSRVQQLTSGGDTHSKGDASSQGDSAFRRLTVLDGDNYYGERCELGYNNWAVLGSPATGLNAPSPTAFYHEGQRRLTDLSLRLPSGFPVGSSKWQTVMQMKQAQPYNNPAPAPMIEMEVMDNRWIVIDDWHEVWSAPAEAGAWTRFSFDVNYSQDPSKGSIQVHVDLNGDGDSSDANETSPTIHTATLRAETDGPEHWLPVGASIPSHLRAGIYQDPSKPCPTTVACSVDLDNVQVYGP
jgi:hypothetical protein